MSNEANTDPEEPVDDGPEQTEPDDDDPAPEPEPDPNERTPNEDRPVPLAPGRHNRRTDAAVADARHDAHALSLRLGGASYRRIAEVQGCSTSVAFERVKRAIAAHVPREDVDEYRKISAERLEVTIGRLLEIIGDRRERALVDEHGNTVTDPLTGELVTVPVVRPDVLLAAVGNLVRTEDRLAKLLGADTPVEQRVRVRKVDDLDARIEDLLEQMRSREVTG